MIFLECGAAFCGVISLHDIYHNNGPLVLISSTGLLFIFYVPTLWISLVNYFPDETPWQSPGLVLLGIAGALSLIFLTVYISEISPSTIRGALVSTVFLQIAGGQIVYHLLSLLSSSTTREIQSWQWMLAIILPIIHVTVTISGVLPESPRWLYRKMTLSLTSSSHFLDPYPQGHIQQAKESLELIRSSCEVFKEVKAMEVSLGEEVEAAERQQEKEKELKFLDRLTIIWYKVPFERIIVGFGSIVAQQFVGISMIMHYSYTIFLLTTNLCNTSKTENGNAEIASSKIPLITSSLVLVGTLICTTLVDRLGRRRLLLVSICGIISSLGLLSCLFYTGSNSVGNIIFPFLNSNLRNENREFWYDIGEERASGMGLLALTALAMYIVFYSLGIGTIPWIINSEIYPIKYRTICLVMINVVYWCSKIIVQDFFFDSLGCYLSVAEMLLMLLLFSVGVGLFIYIYIPETKGLQLEEVEKVLMREKYIKMNDYHLEDEDTELHKELRAVLIAT
ncbi:hypothetical protein C5167_043069 [Papaver somniferum]|uniref:Major facilitator superfamily (MFS) profile domain-containing protein n=2 Tax=Papaver somniferum TaxID=3469 RepID=A0A4Y7L4M9_PAPSO|nr:hypothetical protein C5167_043069 [Papaver somniferum]